MKCVCVWMCGCIGSGGSGGSGGGGNRAVKALAARRKISVNKLIEELSTQALAEFDSEVRFRALAASCRVRKGLDVLDKLDAHFGSD